MACFLVSAAEAVIVTAAAKAAEKKEPEQVDAAHETQRQIPFSRKLKWLANMLWGGAVLLAFEHVWHGEVVPWFPFLTAMNDPGDTAEMLHEMATIGVTMVVLVTAVWLCMVLITGAMEKKAHFSQMAVE